MTSTEAAKAPVRRPNRQEIEVLTEFLTARGVEARRPGASVDPVVSVLFIQLMLRASALTSLAVLHDQWDEEAEHCWWLLIRLADSYGDHRDFPAEIRHFSGAYDSAPGGWL